MSRFPTTAVVLAVAVLGLIAAGFIFWPKASQRYGQVAAVRGERSEIHLVETIVHANGRIAREELRLDNVDGSSRAAYAVTDRRGTVARFAEPMRGYDVTFAFDLLVRDGIWDLHTPKVFHGSTSTTYTIAIAQTAGTKSGSHRFSFADPHWLATAAGRQYEIHLDKNAPVPTQEQLLHLRSTANADPRYQKIVDDFASFGPPGFKQTVAAARKKLLSS